jgi:two-component system, cell cycle sensor histidine kinase and response regulator CckA
LRWDGEEFPMEASISKTSLNGQLFYTVILRDITARKREDAERSELEARLRQSQKMEAIGTLAGGIAHDFNNMLAVISGNIELALRDVEPGSKTHARLAEIEKAGRRAKDLVRQILTFSRPQKVERNLVDLRKAVEESLQMLAAALPASVELRRALAPDTPLVAADPTQIHQILANLCTNAWHAMDGRPGVIEVKLERLMVAADTLVDADELRPGLYARLVVTDNGDGMDAATLSRIFEPFFTTKPAGLGTGLGLSVVHGIVQSHGGRIGVRSEPGKGTEVTVSLPAVEASGAPGTKHPDSGEQRQPGSGGERVLFLDDEEAIVAIATEMLSHLGYRVSGFTAPADAVAALKANPDDFDVAITDYNMPDASGLEVAGEFRHVKPDLPIIIASGYLSEELTRTIASAGLQALLAKPVSGEELARVVRDVLEGAAGH